MNRSIILIFLLFLQIFFVFRRTSDVHRFISTSFSLIAAENKNRVHGDNRWQRMTKSWLFDDKKEFYLFQQKNVTEKFRKCGRRVRFRRNEAPPFCSSPWWSWYRRHNRFFLLRHRRRGKYKLERLFGAKILQAGVVFPTLNSLHNLRTLPISWSVCC